MLITTSQKRLHLHNDILHLTYNNDVLNSVENEKVLGVRIDNNLTWSIHINFNAKKISSNLWLLSKLKDYLSTEHRVQFYKTYIQPHIDYCSTIWGGTSQYNLNRIYRLQKKAVKIIVNYQYDNIANSMDELKILNIYERIFLRKAKFMFKVSKSVLPSYVNQMFSFRPFNETLQRCIGILYSKAKKRNFQTKLRERSGSVVECLTRDRRAAGSSLTGVTALWSLSKTHLS